MDPRYDEDAGMSRQMQQIHRVRTGRITKSGTVDMRTRPKANTNRIPKGLLEIQLMVSSPLILISPASILCRKTLRCGCKKAHIKGSVWVMLTAALEQVVQDCRAAKDGCVLTIERVPDPSHEGGVRDMVRNMNLYSQEYTEFPMPQYNGPEALLKSSPIECSIVNCPACRLFFGVNKFVTETIARAEDLEIEALCLVNFFAKLRIEIKADPEIAKKVADPHELLWNGYTKHLCRRSVYQMMLAIVGDLRNHDICYPNKSLTYARKVKLLCERWFDITREIFDIKFAIQDHSDKMFVFDRVFDIDQKGQDNEDDSDSEFLLCNEQASPEKTMVHLLCGHTFCVTCCKHWLVHSPVDLHDFKYRYRCPICRKCMRCGAEDCVIHTIDTPDLFDPYVKEVTLWPLPLEPLLQLGLGLDHLPTLDVPDIDDIPDRNDTSELPDVPSLEKLHPFRNMKASACVKLREDSLRLRVCMGYNLQLCAVLRGDHDDEVPEEFNTHLLELFGLLRQLQDLFYRADLHCDWSSKVSDQPSYPGQSPDVTLPRSFSVPAQEEAGALTNRLRNASYESNWDAFGWEVDMRDQPKTHYLTYPLKVIPGDQFYHYLLALVAKDWYDPEQML